MERQSVTKTKKTGAPVAQMQRRAADASSASHSLLGLQSSVGNQAVQRLLGSDYFQAKLQISSPGD